MKIFVYPVSGPVLHAVILPAVDTCSLSVPLGRRWMPPDDARHQSYRLAYEGEQSSQDLWRLATEEEKVRVLATLDEEDRGAVL